MIQADYRRELNHSYMVIRNTIPHLTRQYAYRMIRENRIRGLLGCQERMVDGESCLYFEISSKQSLQQFYEGKKLNAAMIRQILRAVVQLQDDMGEYMLDGESLLLEPSCMFIDVETEELFFCFYPGWGKGQNPYTELADFFLEHVDHGMETAVNLAYQFYKVSKAASFVLSSFMPFADRECASVESDDKILPQAAAEAVGTAYEQYPFGEEETSEQRCPVQQKAEKKKSWFGRIWNNVFGRKGNMKRVDSEKDHTGNQDMEYGQSLWDIYADKLENKNAGETIYFSDLEKPKSRPPGIPFLVELGGVRRFCLENLPVTVGKLSKKAGVVLEDPSVSRVHARFFEEMDDVWLIDMNSRNGTIVNDKKLSPNEAVRIEPGDKIQFGRERFEFTFIDSKKE